MKKRKTTVEKECSEVRKREGSFTNGINLANPSRHYVKRAVPPLLPSLNNWAQ